MLVYCIGKLSRLCSRHKKMRKHTVWSANDGDVPEAMFVYSGVKLEDVSSLPVGKG